MRDHDYEYQGRPYSRLSEGDRKELDRVADLVFVLAAAGRIHLVQKRNGLGDFIYIAVVRGAARTSGAAKVQP